MPGAGTPQTLLEAIGSSAGGGFITAPMPNAPTGTNAASVEGGFPPITMQEELSGGEPPLGQDMNGFLFLISSHTLWVECGQLYPFNSTLATAIGGYLAGSILGMADGTGIWLNTVNGNITNPDTGGAGWVPMTAYGKTTLTGLTGGTITLTAAQSKYQVVILDGVLTSNLTLILPQNIQEWLFINNTSGAFTTAVITAAGGSVGVQLPQGGFGAPTGVYSIGDGNIYPTVAPLSVPIAQAPTPSTLVERDNTGQVFATRFNQNSASNENPNIGAVFVENLSADGYLRKATLSYFLSVCALQSIGGQIQPSQIVSAAVTQFTALILASAALTGVPTAPTATPGTRSTQVATTAFANPGASLLSNGYEITASGAVRMWGNALYTGVGSTFVINFPVAFPTACLWAAGNPSVGGYGPGTQSFNVNSVTFNMNNLGGTAQTIYWEARGN